MFIQPIHKTSNFCDYGLFFTDNLAIFAKISRSRIRVSHKSDTRVVWPSSRLQCQLNRVPVLPTDL